jgi:hypothetical protein
VRQSPASMVVNMEAEEATALEAVTRRQPVKLQHSEDFVRAIINCSVYELELAL